MPNVHDKDNEPMILDLIQDPIFAHPQAICIPRSELLGSRWSRIMREPPNRVRNTVTFPLLDARQRLLSATLNDQLPTQVSASASISAIACSKDTWSDGCRFASS